MQARRSLKQLKQISVQRQQNKRRRKHDQPPATSNEDEFSPWVPRNLIYFNEVCKDIFKAENPMTLIEQAEGLFADISDKRTRRSSSAVFNSLFETEDMGNDNDADMFDQSDEEALTELEYDL